MNDALETANDRASMVELVEQSVIVWTRSAVARLLEDDGYVPQPRH